MNVEEYIAQYPIEIQHRLFAIRRMIREVAPESHELILWAMPTYKLERNLIHFAAYSKHIGIYPTPEAIVAFQPRLVNYKTSKGAFQIPHSVDLPLSLIRDIVLYRLEKERERNT